jgi:hypothetical protein
MVFRETTFRETVIPERCLTCKTRLGVTPDRPFHIHGIPIASITITNDGDVLGGFMDITALLHITMSKE